MVDLELIEIRPNEKKIYASRLLYRIPHYDNSPPRLVGRATDYILKQAEVFSAREGSADQELSYAMQLVSVENAQKIIQQMKYFKRWVQSLGSLDRSQKTVPLLFLGLVRRIDRKEFS